MRMETYNKWVGRRFGKLTVISLNEYRNGNYTWHCACDCGKTKLASRTYLLQSKNPSCGCARANPDAYVRTIYTRYVRQAKERSIPWNLSQAEVSEIVKKKCIYCGEYPANVDSKSKRKYNGIDRLDSKKGYEKGNCYACCITCNRAKSDRSLSEFHRWIVQVYEHSIADRS